MIPLAPIIEKHLPRIRALRRDLHAHPELGFEEFETSEKVAVILAELPGFSVRRKVAVTGIVATLDAAKPGPCVALRADMDCLPITEETGLPYASTKPGLMHACGHDGHTAALVGAALVLHETRDDLKGPVKLIFQPAEEGRFGARHMIEEGALDDPPVAATFGMHNEPQPELEFGRVALRSGPFYGGGTTFEIKVTGAGGHAAMPQQVTDTVLIASHIVTALQSIVSRNTDPFEALVVSVTRFQGGTTHNVIPETVELGGTIRSLSPALLERAQERMRVIAESTAAAFGGSAVAKFKPGYPVVVNDRRAAAYCAAVAREVAGAESVSDSFSPTLVSEDFAFYLHRQPGCFFKIGTRPPEIPELPGLHHPRFNFNEDILPLAIAMHVELARRFADDWSNFSKS
jgi:amidohydrolase